MSVVGIGNKEALLKVAEEFGIAANVVAKTIYRAINSVAAKTATRSRREVVGRVNLTQSYVRDRMILNRATSAKQSAEIKGRQRPTRLATYLAKQVMRPQDKERARERPAKGDPLRGIPPGKIQSGISVSVLRGSGRKVVAGGKSFFVPLRAGKEGFANGMGVFTRTGTGRKDIKQRYGPSVDSVLGRVFERIYPEVATDLEAAIERQAKYEFAKALAR